MRLKPEPPWDDVWRVDLPACSILVDGSGLPYDRPRLYIDAASSSSFEAVRAKLCWSCPELVCWDVPGPEESLVELRWIDEWSPALRLETALDHVEARLASPTFAQAVDVILAWAQAATIIIEIGTAGCEPVASDGELCVLVDPHWVHWETPQTSPLLWSEGNAHFAAVAAPFCCCDDAVRKLSAGTERLCIRVDPSIKIELPPDLENHRIPPRHAVPGRRPGLPAALNSTRSPGTTPGRYEGRLPDSCY